MFPQTMDITPEREEETASMREAFRKLAGEDMEIDAYELREILDAALKKGKPWLHHYNITFFLNNITLCNFE